MIGIWRNRCKNGNRRWNIKREILSVIPMGNSMWCRQLRAEWLWSILIHPRKCKDGNMRLNVIESLIRRLDSKPFIRWMLLHFIPFSRHLPLEEVMEWSISGTEPIRSGYVSFHRTIHRLHHWISIGMDRWLPLLVRIHGNTETNSGRAMQFGFGELRNRNQSQRLKNQINDRIHSIENSWGSMRKMEIEFLFTIYDHDRQIALSLLARIVLLSVKKIMFQFSSIFKPKR